MKKICKNGKNVIDECWKNMYNKNMNYRYLQNK